MMRKFCYEKSILIVLILGVLPYTLHGQSAFRKEKKVKRKDVSNALSTSIRKFIEIESESEGGLQEWFTINPNNGDTILYKGLLEGVPVGRWKQLRGKLIIENEGNYTTSYRSKYQFEIYERKFDLLRYDTSEVNTMKVPDKIGKFSESGESFHKFIALNLWYPSEARDNNIQGTAYAKLRLDREGHLHFESIVKGINPYLDVAIIDVIEKSPKWYSPGMTNGKPTEYYFVLPFKWTIKY